MGKIKIITDSASDIKREDEKVYNIEIMPFEIALDGVNYLERKDFTEREFYKIMGQSSKIPTTNQILKHRFLEIYKRFYDEGYSDIIYISINSKGSSTNQNAHLAVKVFFEKNPECKDKFNIYVIDAGTYSYAYGYAVKIAAQKAIENAPVREILAFLEDWLAHVRVILAPYSLEYAKKSGRISAAAAFAGELLGLRAIIMFENGESKIIDKVRHDKNVIPAIIKNAKKRMIPQTPYCVIIGELEDRNQEIIAECKKAFGYDPADIIYVGATIAANSGPKVVAVIVKTTDNN